MDRFISLHLGGATLLSCTEHRALAVRRLQLLDALFHDPHRLPHLLHANEIAVVAVAVLPDRNVEIHLGVTVVRLRFAQIPGRAGTAYQNARKSPSPRLLKCQSADIHVTRFEDAVEREQPVQIVDDTEKWIAPGLDVVDQLWRKILVHAPGPIVVGVHPAPGCALIENHQLLALLEPHNGGVNAPTSMAWVVTFRRCDKMRLISW
jgi:hypothetical protein